MAHKKKITEHFRNDMHDLEKKVCCTRVAPFQKYADKTEHASILHQKITSVDGNRGPSNMVRWAKLPLDHQI